MIVGEVTVRQMMIKRKECVSGHLRYEEGSGEAQGRSGVIGQKSDAGKKSGLLRSSRGGF